MNPVVEVVGMMAAFVVWGGLATLFLLPYVKRQLADFPLHAKRTPFRALLGAVAVGVAIAHGGTKPPTPVPAVHYLDWDAENRVMTNATCTAYVVVTNGIDRFEAGMTYVVKDAVKTEFSRIAVDGTEAKPSCLILCDGGSLSADLGIELVIGHKLVICEQADGDPDATRQLTADGSGEFWSGIGTKDGDNCDGGSVVVNGGIVNATGGNQAAGIGGGFFGAGAAVTVNGGMVSAHGGSGAAGFGGGYNGAGGVLNVNGGTLTAEGGTDAPGIGAGLSAAEDPLDVGTVTFGLGMKYRVLAGPEFTDLVEVTAEDFAANHSATCAVITPAADRKAVEIQRPSAIAGLVYTGEEQPGFEPYDPRIVLKDGTVSETDVGGYAAAFALPPDTETETYAWDDESVGIITNNWSIAPRDVTDDCVAFAAIPGQAYTGLEVRPPVTMTFAGVKRTQDVDYTVVYADNIKVGIATVTVTGVGNFSGEKVLPFEILLNPAAKGRYLSYDLVEDLGVEIPDDVDYAKGDKVTVKAEGLAKGLKLAQDKTTLAWILSGVPTETVDFEKQPMYARVTVTYKDKTKGDKGKVETLQPVVLSIAPSEVRTLDSGALNEVYSPVDVAALWPEVADAKDHPKEWSFKGWPAGIKYNAAAKDASWSYKGSDGKPVKTSAAPWTVYGQPTKAGEYPITATHKHKLAGGKTTVSETFSAILTVWGDDGATQYRYADQAYVATTMKTLEGVTAASGLPTGIKFNKADGSLAGTPTKPGVFAVTVTKTDKSKETFLWKVTDGENDGILGNIGWEIAESAVTVMQGVIQGWPVAMPDGAKVTASGLPVGLKLVQDKTTKAWSIAGTPTKNGNYVVTFKTVRNGVTVAERVSVIVTANEWSGSWYGVQTGGASDASLLAEVTVSANGTVKLVYTEASTNYSAKGVVQSSVRKTTVTVKNLDAGGMTATLTLPKDKKDPLSADRTCVLCFGYNKMQVEGAPTIGLFESDPSWVEYDVSPVVLEESGGGVTSAYGYLTATYKSGKFTYAGKLWDGTAVKGTAYPLADSSHYISPVLVTDKAKNAVTIILAGSGVGMYALVRENGKYHSGIESLSAGYSTEDLKSKKFNQMMPDATKLVVLTDAGELELPLAAKNLAASVSAQGLVKFTVTDEDGWKWACELLPVTFDGELQFRGIATGTKKDEATRACPVWAK